MAAATIHQCHQCAQLRPASFVGPILFWKVRYEREVPHKDACQMKARHIVHLSTYPADDIRIFQKACRSEVAEGYEVTQIVCHERDQIVDGVKIRALPPSNGRLS